jgi:hypothetical protein
MDGPGPPAVFLGDLDDPWVAAIAAALPRDAIRIPCAGDLPDDWPAPAQNAQTLILHRPILTPSDADRVRKLREIAGHPPKKIILCIGPHARALDVGRWADLVALTIPEATAAEVIARHVRGPNQPGPRRLKLAIISGQHELRLALAEACRALGHDAQPARSWIEVEAGIPAVWDVPVLEPGWDAALAVEAGTRPVVALLGFADRATVGRARSAGASACLDLPWDLDDLDYVLGRIASRVGEPAHVLPLGPSGIKIGERVTQVWRSGETVGFGGNGG